MCVCVCVCVSELSFLLKVVFSVKKNKNSKRKRKKNPGYRPFRFFSFWIMTQCFGVMTFRNNFKNNDLGVLKNHSEL